MVHEPIDLLNKRTRVSDCRLKVGQDVPPPKTKRKLPPGIEPGRRRKVNTNIIIFLEPAEKRGWDW